MRADWYLRRTFSGVLMPRYAITLLHSPAQADAFATEIPRLPEVALAAAKGKVASFGDVQHRVLSRDGSTHEVCFTAEELDVATIRQELLAELEDVDLAVQLEGERRRRPAMVFFDMDSTLIQIECIDELARAHGVVDRVSDITRRAMEGELDYAGSLKERVALLEGLDFSAADAIAASLPLTPGTERLLAVLKQLGTKTAVLSGGYTFAAHPLRDQLGLDHAHANVLAVEDGKLLGHVTGTVVTPERKAELVRELRAAEGIAEDAFVLAVGDGSNDLIMMSAAGFGVAFHAKPRVRAAATTSVAKGGLDRLLYILGYDDDAIDAMVR